MPFGGSPHLSVATAAKPTQSEIGEITEILVLAAAALELAIEVVRLVRTALIRAKDDES